MNSARFDTISRFFTARRLRRQALAQAGAGIAAAKGGKERAARCSVLGD